MLVFWSHTSKDLVVFLSGSVLKSICKKKNKNTKPPQNKHKNLTNQPNKKTQTHKNPQNSQTKKLPTNWSAVMLVSKFKLKRKLLSLETIFNDATIFITHELLWGLLLYVTDLGT